MDVTEGLLRHTGVGVQQGDQRLVEPPALGQLHGRNANALLVHVVSGGGESEAADVGHVGDGAGEGDQVLATETPAG